MNKKFGILSVFIAFHGVVPSAAQAEHRTYIVAGASNTSDLVTHEFNYSNRLFFNHLALEREITDEIRLRISYWNYGTARAPVLAANVLDPITGLSTVVSGTRERGLSELVVTVSDNWYFGGLHSYIGIGLGIFRRSENLTYTEPEFSRQDTWVEGARILFLGADYNLTADVVAGLGLYYKYNTDTKVDYLARAVEIKYRF